MAVTCSIEFPDSPAGRASIGLVVADLLVARRQFSCAPTHDGPSPGFVLSWPGEPLESTPTDETAA